MSKLYELCPSCKNPKGSVNRKDSLGTLLPRDCESCRGMGFVEIGLTTGQVDRLVSAELSRLGDPSAVVVDVDELAYALEESVKLQSHYATNLNAWDGGGRRTFANGKAWIDRLKECREAKGGGL